MSIASIFNIDHRVKNEPLRISSKFSLIPSFLPLSSRFYNVAQAWRNLSTGEGEEGTGPSATCCPCGHNDPGGRAFDWRWDLGPTFCNLFLRIIRLMCMWIKGWIFGLPPHGLTVQGDARLFIEWTRCSFIGFLTRCSPSILTRCSLSSNLTRCSLSFI
jgi:hypothetical protein